MRDAGLDMLVASAPENLFYISDIPTSFTSSNRLLFCSRRISPLMCVLPQEGEPAIVLSAAALDVAQKHTWIKDLRLYPTGTYIWRKRALKLSGKSFTETLTETVSEKLEGRTNCVVALELNDISSLNYQSLKNAFPNHSFVDGNETIMWCRMIKNPEEIVRFKIANRILCKVMKKVEDLMKDRPSEFDLDTLLKSEMLKEGAESWQQTTIAAGKLSGPDIYNQPASKRRLKSGDLIRLDVGCVYKGYTADLSRTYAVGCIHPKAAKTYGVLKEAFLANIHELKPGTKASEINIRVVNYVRQHLDSNYYRGNVGHGVGVELYDKPLLGAEDHTPLQAGMTLSFEVPYHISGLAGLNLEDSVLITPKGKQVVSNYDRNIIVV
jgi:Xaa-Pro dipeptidase